MKQQDTQTSILILHFCITLQTLKNSDVGTPRNRAYITNLNDLKQRGEAGAFVYDFTGHYCGDYGEALFILKYHVNKWADSVKSKAQLLKQIEKLEAKGK